jgi:UDP-N-acetylmuramyl pentapeptide phosphotransferase/UDP-N-acetylglucosamine-1-phosphate transferase
VAQQPRLTRCITALRYAARLVALGALYGAGAVAFAVIMANLRNLLAGMDGLGLFVIALAITCTLYARVVWVLARAR